MLPVSLRISIVIAERYDLSDIADWTRIRHPREDRYGIREKYLASRALRPRSLHRPRLTPRNAIFE